MHPSIVSTGSSGTEDNRDTAGLQCLDLTSDESGSAEDVL